MQNHLTLLQNELSNLKESATSGDIPAHEAFMLINESGLSDLFKKTIDEIKSFAIEELKNNYLDGNEKTYRSMGYSYTIRDGSTRYYFSDVPEIKKKKDLAESTQAFKDYKESEKKYKTAFLMKMKNQIMVDEETGEIVDPSNVKVVYSKDSISIKKNK